MKQSEEIYKVLHDEIVSGVLPSDTPLREVELAKRFGVSRTPIREVLHRLASERLIRIIPNTGSFVGAFTWDEVHEVFEIRQLLEIYAAGQTADRILPTDLDRFEKIYSACEEAYEKFDTEAYAEQDEAFHELLNSLSGNQLLLDLIHQMNDRAKLITMRRANYKQGEMKTSLDGHRQIIDALKERDSEKVKKLMEIHGKHIFTV